MWKNNALYMVKYSYKNFLLILQIHGSTPYLYIETDS